MMGGCSLMTSSTVEKANIPSNLLQPCPELQLLENNTGKALLLWSVDTVVKYNECRAKQKALVTAVVTKP